MPVHTSGPRIYRSVRFKHLVKKAGSASGARPSNISLNLTPFVDMMTILVAFLLMVFSATKLAQVQAGLDLPSTTGSRPKELQDAPVIAITKSDIQFNSESIVTIESVMRDETPGKIEPLFDRLQGAATKIREEIGSPGSKVSDDLKKACEEAKTNVRQKVGHICPDGLAILQADEATDTRLINKVVVTAKIAGFNNLLFAVKNK
ncbi:MAG: biopolymer transporter ExbD [Deltaproteobacteria bacterium]|nr:biopolymer transporter ExbD [Deltaproteobacteria bacterium]MCW5802731.1 biopolymer transporter ExbD [Deltaproteobacteria bacterium]